MRSGGGQIAVDRMGEKTQSFASYVEEAPTLRRENC